MAFRNENNRGFFGVQAKLNIGQPGDKYEKEADHVADKVVNKTATQPGIRKKGKGEEELQQKPLAETISTVQKQELKEEEKPVQKQGNQDEEKEVQAKCADCEKEEKVQKQAETEEEEPVQKKEEEEEIQAKPDKMEEEPVQMQEEEEVQKQGNTEEEEPVQKQAKAEEEEPVQKKEEEDEVQAKSNNAQTGNPGKNNLEGKLSNAKGTGNKMDARTKQEMEASFGADFSNVNIHTGSKAEQMSKKLGAQAFTHGNNIYFNEGKYNPNSKEGKHLLAHELTHTIQQTGMLQKKPDKTLKPDYCQYASGYNMAFYDALEDETKRRAKDWAKNFNALGISKGGDIKQDQAISDKNNVADTIADVNDKLKDECGDDTVPKLKNLAIFAHGTTDWCGIGNAGITGSNAKALVKKIAPYLSNDINVILYACSVARGTSEKENWKKGTLDSGGKDALAGKFSDILHENDVKNAKVWGHTTVGHTSRNFALRYFSSNAKNAPGVSYVSEHVFTPYEVYLIKEEVIQHLESEGYETDVVTDNYPDWFFENLRDYFYSAYAKAMGEKDYNGIHLAEAAPVYPWEVAKVINEYWDTEYWPAHKEKFMKLVKKKLKPAKAEAAPKTR